MRERLGAIAGQPTDRKDDGEDRDGRGERRTIRSGRRAAQGPPRGETAIGSPAGGTSSCDRLATVRLETPVRADLAGASGADP